MIKSVIFKLANNVFDIDIIKLYEQFKNIEFKSKLELKKDQETQLNRMLIHCYNNVPYYKEIFNNLNIKYDDINTIEDLGKLPVLTKEIVKKNPNQFIPKNLVQFKHKQGRTGGTTGTPFIFYIDHKQRIRSIALLYLGLTNAGYNFGDKILFLGGSSIGGSGSIGIKYFYKYGLNFHKLSSFDMEERNLKLYYNTLVKEKPLYIRGYASSLYFLADWIDKSNLNNYKFNAVFSMTEKLHDYMREKIENVFQCKVFDQYGLYDGGLSAYECVKHDGMHIDTQNSIMETVDSNNMENCESEGRVLATSLYNYAYPLIRYETGDIATVTEELCSCGRQTKRIKEIVGRSVDILQSPDGKYIHGWIFSYIFKVHCQGIKQYQVIQEDLFNITIKIIKEKNFDENQIKMINKIVHDRAPMWILNFEFVDSIDTTEAGKFKYIINKLNSQKHDS
ncbi:MAG: phenylacetate--CoA ligase family protein [Ignavibacteriae bacterium]|nr:phenylacetate--CoA ligase family protein [Ignavibacteriota bacterium]